MGKTEKGQAGKGQELSQQSGKGDDNDDGIALPWRRTMQAADGGEEVDRPSDDASRIVFNLSSLLFAKACRRWAIAPCHLIASAALFLSSSTGSSAATRLAGLKRAFLASYSAGTLQSNSSIPTSGLWRLDQGKTTPHCNLLAWCLGLISRAPLTASLLRFPTYCPRAYATVSAQDFADKGWSGELGDARCLPAARFTDGDLHTFHDAFALWVCHGLALDRTGHSLYFELALREDTALDGNR
ncbi:hypothetical protein FDECE_2636 [Fusarium decemcellulare]|nr:hypothetical protein FDECE_2636 [Fusarium decemcellulare]